MKPFNASGAFLFDVVEKTQIRRKAVRGAGFTILSGGTVLAIQIVATVVLARLLTPKDFGVVAMVTTFSLLLANFGLNGFTEAIVQSESISHELASTLFWINLGCGIVLTAAFAGAGSLLAWFYRDPLVRPVAEGISLTILVTSSSVIHLALLKRAMRFSQISINDIRARLISVALSIALGIAGWAYWSLVAGAVALTLSQAVGAWILCRWLPGPPRRVAGLGRTLRFALHTYGCFSVNYGARNTDNLLVGWRFSAQSLGFYKKAYDLFALSASQLVASISVVVVGALSRFNRDTTQYRRHLLAATTIMAFIGMGIGLDLTLTGKDVIRLLLGPGWEPAGRIFTFFGPGIGVMILYYTHSWIHLSIGRPERWFRWTLVEFAVTVTLFLIALPHGPVGIAIAWTASFWILTVPALWFAGRPIGLSVVPTLKAIWRYPAASLIAGLLITMILRHWPGLAALDNTTGAFLRVITTSALVFVTYIPAVILLHGGFAPVNQILLLVRELIGKRKSESVMVID